MTAKIKIDLDRQLGAIDRNIFGGFAEHLGRCIYGGMFAEGSPLSDQDGFRTDVLDALKRLQMPLIRYPGGNFVSGYRWMDGIGPRDQRPPRMELAWHTAETNRFGTDEFIKWCRKLGTEPYMVVNCGDGTQREAQDWVEYCNGNNDTEMVRLRRKNGSGAPHNVKYWGIGNEVYGPWQIGAKTPEEYARACTEFGKVMKWIDPSIKLIASCCHEAGFKALERTALLVEQAADLIDYISIHWYVGNRENDFATYMTTSELIEDILTTYEGLLDKQLYDKGKRDKVKIAVDEWNVWYKGGAEDEDGEKYNLEDALVVAEQLMAILRHCKSVTMANIAQIVNVIAPVYTSPEGLFLQTIFHPFELISRESGKLALDACTVCDTFEAGGRTGCPMLDVAATFDPETKQVSLFVINRTLDGVEAEIDLQGFSGASGRAYVVNGPDIKSMNGFDNPEVVTTREAAFDAEKPVFAFEPHSFTAICFEAR